MVGYYEGFVGELSVKSRWSRVARIEINLNVLYNVTMFFLAKKRLTGTLIVSFFNNQAHQLLSY